MKYILSKMIVTKITDIDNFMNPVQIKISGKNNLAIKWENESESIIPLKYLREECPCAGCKGETILLRTYKPRNAITITPGRYLIKNMETVGGYAVQITWEDGHNTGIYTWDYLIKLDRDQNRNAEQNYKPLI